MTVINPNSVAGINSITVQSGEALSVHKSDGSLIKTIVSASGVSTFTSASIGAATTDNNRDASINIGLGASISQHTVNSLSLGTGGDERVSIKSDGKVGINESNPAVFGVHSSQSSESVYYRADSGSVDTIFGSSTALGYAIAGTTSNHDLTLWANNSPRVRIKTSGDVGIGTDTLNAPLTVVQNDNAGYIASFRQKNSGNSAQILIDGPTDNNIRPTSIDLAQAGTVKWSLGQAYAALSDRAFHIATSSLSANDTNARLTISTTGKVGISSRSPNSLLTVGPNPNAARSSHPTVLISPASGNASLMLRGNSPTIDFDSTSGGNAQVCTDNAALTINAGTIDNPALNSGEMVRIDASGRVLIGTATARAVGGESNPRLHIEGSGATSNSWVNLTRFSDNNGASNIQFAKSRSDTPGTYTVVQNDDKLGQISFLGSDGTDMANYAAKIECFVDGTPGSNDMPGRIVFSTTADDSSSPTEGLRLTSDKIVNIANQGTVFGRLNVPIPTQSGGSAIQVMNTASGSGDGTLTNVVLRSVNSAGNQWSHSQYRSQSHQFQVQTDNKITINSNGLCFNADTTAANALDDYEEGTFTPTATFETSDDGNKVYSSQGGTYTKIGRMVNCNMILAFSNRGTGSGRLRFNGLPFTVGDTLSNTILEASATVSYFAGLISSVSGIHPAAVSGTDQIVFYAITGQYGASTSDFGYSHVGNSFSIRMSITYNVA